MALAVPLGVLWQDLARVTAPLVVFAAIGSMYLSTVRLDTRLLAGWLRRPLLPIALVLWAMVVLPLAGLAIGWTGVLPVAMAVALVLIAATPPIISVGTYCAFLGTEAELMLIAALPATVLSIASLPAFAAAIGVEGIAPQAMLGKLFAFVGVALGGAIVTRLFVSRERVEAHARTIDLLLIVTAGIVAIGVTDGLLAVIVARPIAALESFVAALAINAGLQAVTWLAFARRRPVEAGSAAAVGGSRNMALLLALTIGAVSPELQLVLVMAQLQLFLAPMLMRPVYARFGVSVARV
jgi:bile acid:Na+ symporter, BASS family